MSALFLVCTLLLVCGIVDEEALATFLNLLDIARNIDAFTPQQHHKMSSWRLEINQHISLIREVLVRLLNLTDSFIGINPSSSNITRYWRPLTLLVTTPFF